LLKRICTKAWTYLNLSLSSHPKVTNQKDMSAQKQSGEQAHGLRHFLTSNNYALSRRVLSIVLINVAVTLGLMSYMHHRNNEIQQHFNAIDNFNIPAIAATYEMEINLQEISLRTFKYLENPHSDARKNIADDIADFERHLNQYKSLLHASDQTALPAAHQIELHHQQLVDMGAKIMALEDEIDQLKPAKQGAPEQFTGELVTDRQGYIANLVAKKNAEIKKFVDLRNEMDELLDEDIQIHSEKHLTDRRAKGLATVKHTSTAMALLAAFVTILGVYSILYLYQLALVPLRKLTQGANKFSVGDLDHTIEIKKKNELGNLAKVLNKMASNLKRYTLDLKNANLLLEQRVEERTQQLNYIASYDTLTGLMNRGSFDLLLKDELTKAKKNNKKLALMLLDLDNFKNINDSFGHSQGDLFLQEVGRRLKAQVRATDTVARLGGDEFCILIKDLETIELLEHKAQLLLDSLTDPIQLQGGNPHVSASIGIAFFPDHAKTSAEFIKAADCAMYTVKRTDKSNYAFYDELMADELEYQLTMDAALDNAFIRNEFIVYYQPQVNLQTRKIFSMEALIRWQVPGKELMLPGSFLPHLERLNLIQTLDEWVLETACRQAVKWSEQGLGELGVAVNISTHHYESNGFVDSVADVLKRTGLAPARLEIEILEGAPRNLQRHTEICNALHAIGVRVAIDDFGTGYSSLSVLQHLNVDTLKIDRQFTANLLTSSQSYLMVQSILNLAKEFGYETLAEGVENETQAKALKNLGCQLAQGYYYARPETAQKITNLLKKSLTLK
jgi:diguanylate cyclase (GGDEF)-like protein